MNDWKDKTCEDCVYCVEGYCRESRPSIRIIKYHQPICSHHTTEEQRVEREQILVEMANKHARMILEAAEQRETPV